MQVESKFISIKRKTLLRFVVAVLILGIVTPVLADYLGPDRTTTTSEVDTYDYGVWARDNNKVPYCLDKKGNKADDCIVCEWKRKSGNACGDATYWYTLGTRSEVVETTINLDPATISNSLQNCNLNNGWCNTLPTLSLNGSEPLSGYSILAVEGSLNGQTFACSGSTCDVPLNEGNNDFTFWALSSYGDSSGMGTLSAKVDTVSPNVGLDIIGSNGTNSWYVSPATITATGSDSTSGVSSIQLSVNGGAWTVSTTLNDGIYAVDVRVEDNAGNVSDSATTISVDTVTPSISLNVNGTMGSNGWYSSDMQVTANASDLTSGIALLEVSTDGGVYQAYTSPVSFTDGYHTIQFKAIDNAGNQTETSVQEFYVDTIAPAIDLPPEWEVNDTITYKIQDDGSGLSGLRIVIEDEDEKFAKVAWDEVVSGNKFKGEITWDGKFKDGIIAPPGEYLVWVKATDVAGNERIGLGRVIVPSLFSLFPSTKSSSEILIPPADLFDSKDSFPLPANPNPDTSTPPSTSFGGSTTQTNSTTVQSLTLTSGSSSASSTTPSNVLWGATAASMLGAATAYALEEKKKRKEAEARRLVEGAVRRHASQRANRDEEPAMTRQDAQARKHGKELQKIWDANGAAIYEANREYKAKHGKEMDAAARSKAIKDATMDGAFNAGAYASNLEAEKTRRDAQNERMANKMTRFEKEEEARWQASQKVAEEKQKAEELQAGYAAYYAAMRQGEQEAQSSRWDKALDFVQENIVEPIQNTWNTVTIFVQDKIVEPVVTVLDERVYQPYIKPAVEKIKLVTGEWVDTVVKLSVNQIAVPVKQSAPSAHLAKLTLAPALDDDPPTPWENFKEWLRIQFLTLDHPEYPPSDLGAGPHKSRDATVVDYLVERLFWLGEEKFRWYNHYDNAADHMDHYLNNSGKEYEVDVDEMLEELPQFKQEGDDLLQQLVQDALKNNYSGQKSEFDVKSDWVFRYAYETDNWFYAMNGHAYSIGVNVVVNPPRSPGDNPTVKVVYKVFVSDYYTWDMGKDTSFLKDGPFANIQLPDFSGTPYEGKIVDHGDVITIYDSALQELHKAGLAQEFHIGGETEKIVVEFEYNPTDGTLMPLEPDK